MKKIKEIIVIIILFCTYNIFSQATSVNGNPALRETALKANQKRQMQTSKNTREVSSSKVQTTSNHFQVDENDQYQGRKEEFLSQMIVKEIPTDFPKYEKWMGIRHYNEVIEEYYKKHLDIVQEDVKNKLINR